MPPKLSQVQQDTAETLLRAGTPHAIIANTINCSVAKVKKMSQNINNFDQLYRPRIRVLGRPRVITDEMAQVSFSSTYSMFTFFTHKQAVREFLAERPDSYRSDIIDFLFDDFNVDVSLDSVSRMLKRERISRKKA
jgi:hypothetical protein